MERSFFWMGFPLDLVILLELTDEEIRRRIANRLSCLSCGATFSTRLDGCSVGSACPRCGNELMRRNDDTEEALDQRLKSYRELTVPVIDYYESTVPLLLHRIAASEGSEAVFARISSLFCW